MLARTTESPLINTLEPKISPSVSSVIPKKVAEDSDSLKRNISPDMQTLQGEAKTLKADLVHKNALNDLLRTENGYLKSMIESMSKRMEALESISGSNLYHKMEERIAIEMKMLNGRIDHICEDMLTVKSTIKGPNALSSTNDSQPDEELGPKNENIGNGNANLNTNEARNNPALKVCEVKELGLSKTTTTMRLMGVYDPNKNVSKGDDRLNLKKESPLINENIGRLAKPLTSQKEELDHNELTAKKSNTSRIDSMPSLVDRVVNREKYPPSFYHFGNMEESKDTSMRKYIRGALDLDRKFERPKSSKKLIKYLV